MRWLALVLVLLWPFQGLDEATRSAVQARRGPATEPVMRAASDIGKPAIVLGVLLAVACFAGPTAPGAVREMLAVLAGTNLAVEGLKRVTYRARPDGEHKRSNAAFPSSHAANAFALAWAFGRRWRRLLPWTLAGAAVIAVSRIYLDRHWLSDVVVGALLGIAIAAATRHGFARRPGLPPESARV